MLSTHPLGLDSVSLSKAPKRHLWSGVPASVDDEMELTQPQVTSSHLLFIMAVKIGSIKLIIIYLSL